MKTVVTPPTAFDLTTINAVGLELSLEANETARVPSLIRQASQMIVKYCNRPFARQQCSESLYSRGPLMLDTAPILSVDSIFDGSGYEITDYGVDLECGIVFGHEKYIGRSVVITYTLGYYLPGDPLRDLPEDVERACLDTVMGLWYRPERGDPSVKMDRTDGVGQTVYFDTPRQGLGLPPSAIEILQPYVKIR